LTLKTFYASSVSTKVFTYFGIGQNLFIIFSSST